MKRFLCTILLVFIIFSCTACGKSESIPKSVKPEISQMKAICELATMDCYYHNVAKYKDQDASGALWWKKDRHFWIEYSGIVRIGIDISKVKMEVNNEIVTITIPTAEVLSCKVDETTLNKDSFIVASDSAKVEAEHQIEAFKDAQSNMENSAKKDKLLLANAQQRAQNLLEDYVNNIGDSVGKNYEIKWVYLDETETKDKK